MMKTNLIKQCLATVTITVVCVLYIDAQTLPDKAMGCPQIFLDETQSYMWVNVASDPSHKAWSKLSSQYWTVYVDREGVNAYSNANTSSSVNKVLDFMDNCLVAEVNNGFALLYTDKAFGTQSNLSISDKAKVVGWVEISKLLLWSSCPRTQGQVYEKAIMVRDMDELQNKNDLQNTSPYFIKDPNDKKQKTHNRAIDLEIYFVYKHVDGAALCISESKLDAGKKNIIVKGWMPRGFYTSWNDRLCFEPNFGGDAKNGKSIIFNLKEDAMQYKNDLSIANDRDVSILWNEECPETRWPARNVRFPVTDFDSRNYIANVGTIGMLYGSKRNDTKRESQDKIRETEDKFRRIQQKTQVTNIVFVIDGTKSMTKYYKPIADAISNAMQDYSIQGRDIKFGAVIYRNYADEKSNNLIEMFQLSDNYIDFNKWLVTRQTFSAATTEHAEAMYYGINKAIEAMNWDKTNGNFLFLVGDAGNPDTDTRCSENMILKGLYDKNINFVAFQSNHPNIPAYHDFVSQTQCIAHKTVEQRIGRKIRKSDFKISDRFYNYVFEDDKEVLTIGYGYCAPNDSEDSERLRKITEAKIADFDNLTSKLLEQYQTFLDGILDDDKNNSISFEDSEYLKNKYGLSDEDVRIMREKATLLKVKGFASRQAEDVDVFTTSAFLTAQELNELINSLKKVSSSYGTNERAELQRALQDLCLSYLGQQGENIDIDDLISAMRGVTNVTGSNPLSGVSLKDITNPNRVSNAQIDDFKMEIDRSVKRLERLKNDKNCYYESNESKMRYYYILMENMPLMGK